MLHIRSTILFSNDRTVIFLILYENKHFITNSEHPNDDWVGDADIVIPDDSELAKKIISLYPNFDFVFGEDGEISDVIETEPAPVPPAPPTDHERLEALESMFSEIGALSLLGGIKMSQFYKLQIKSGKINIDDVPLRWREQVRKELEV